MDIHLQFLSVIIISSLFVLLMYAALLLRAKNKRLLSTCEEKENVLMVMTELKHQIKAVNDAYRKLHERYKKHLERLKQMFLRQQEDCERMEKVMTEQSQKYCALVNSYSAITEEHGLLLKKMAVMTDIQNKLLDENEQLLKSNPGHLSKEKLVVDHGCVENTVFTVEKHNENEAQNSGGEKEISGNDPVILQCNVITRKSI